MEKLSKLKEKRDNERVKYLLNVIKEKANTSENLMPFFFNAIESYATIGEITKSLKSVWSEYKSEL